MSSYRKTMGEVYNGIYLVEGNIDKIKDIVSKKQASKIDGVMVDLFTASAISQVYDKAGSGTKRKMEILPITKLAAVVMKLVNSKYVPEEVEIYEASPQFDLLKKYGTTIMKMWDKEGKSSDEIAKKLSLNSKDIKTLKGLMDEELDLDLDEDFIVTWKKKEVARHKTEQGARKLWHDLIDNPKKYGIKQDKIRLSQVGTTLKVVKEGLEVDLDEGYMELEFKDKQTAIKAYDYINNKIWSGGSVPYEDFNQEGNSLQIDTDGNLNRRNQMLKDLKSLPSNMKFKVVINEEKSVRQLINPNKEVMIVKKNKVIVIDKKDQNKYLKQGWILAEKFDLDEDHLKPGAKIKVPHKGKMVQGKVVRFDKGGPASPFYVVDVGELASIKVPEHKLKEELDLDEARGMTAHVIVMRKKDNKNLSVSVVANTKNVNAKKKEGYVIDQAILAPNGATASYAKEIDRIIRDGDKNPKTGGYVKEELDLDEAKGIVQPTKDGKGVFKVLPRDTKGMAGKQDPFSMGVYDKSGKKLIKDWGSHPSLEGAKKFARNHGLIEDVDLDEASARADAKRSMSRDRDLGKNKDSADDDSYASDDDIKGASKNIMMQLRKAANLRGTFAVEFGDKKKVKVSPQIAQAVASKYNSLRRPADKEKFQTQIAKSYKDMLKAIKESKVTESRFGTINKQLKGEK